MSHAFPTGISRDLWFLADNCAVCHGPAGKGNRALGAPDLTDAIWLYGGDAGTIRETVWNSRHGVMPRWDDKLDKATIRMLAAYVHSQIGRASWRESGCQYVSISVVAGSLKKKNN